MKVLSVSTFAHPDHFGGAERVITGVANGLAARGHTVTLLTGRTEGTLEEEQRDGVRVVRYPLRPGHPGRFYRSVWRGVRRALAAGVGRDADVLHVHQVLSAVAALAPAGAPIPARVFSFYAPYNQEYLARYRDGHSTGRAPVLPRAISQVLARADRYALRRSDEILVLSEFSREQVLELLPGSANRITVAGAGVDTERFVPAADADAQQSCRRTLGLPTGPQPVLLTVRRLVPRMGLPDLLEACARLHGAGLPLHLAVAGDGAQRSQLQAQVQSLGLDGAVTFLGKVPDERLPDLYKAASLFVLPTRSLEGFGMATVEALSAGLPVVATHAGASVELLRSVPGARLVPPAQPEALAQALQSLLGDPQERARAAAAARAHAREHLGWAHHLDAFEQAAQRARAAHA